MFLGQEKERVTQGKHYEIFICTQEVRIYKVIQIKRDFASLFVSLNLPLVYTLLHHFNIPFFRCC